ncbi:Laminin subunit gamma-1 [Oryzias melastigma]|uniref:Laminin subunit gamma-1 n=1 Tax=Oryzias melastigma TaxID=30732 RepID=A0A834F6W3_ORYME|nr:Laminin subunit gamma-1 [Oryzias melastigma]
MSLKKHRHDDRKATLPLNSDARSSPSACSCSPLGTVDRQTGCSQVTGQCECLPNVAERDCSACQPGHFNLQSGNGCERSVPAHSSIAEFSTIYRWEL